MPDDATLAFRRAVIALPTRVPLMRISRRAVFAEGLASVATLSLAAAPAAGEMGPTTAISVTLMPGCDSEFSFSGNGATETLGLRTNEYAYHLDQPGNNEQVGFSIVTEPNHQFLAFSAATIGSRAEHADIEATWQSKSIQIKASYKTTSPDANNDDQTDSGQLPLVQPFSQKLGRFLIYLSDVDPTGADFTLNSSYTGVKTKVEFRIARKGNILKSSYCDRTKLNTR